MDNQGIIVRCPFCTTRIYLWYLAFNDRCPFCDEPIKIGAFQQEELPFGEVVNVPQEEENN